MKFSINAQTPVSGAGYAEPAVLRAAVTLHVLRTRPGAQAPSPSIRIPDVGTISEIAERMAGPAVAPDADLTVDTASAPRASGIASAAEYHAACVLYAWREYRWAEVDEGEAESAYAEDAPIQDFVDETASDFDLASVDPYMRAQIAREGDFVMTPAL